MFFQIGLLSIEGAKMLNELNFVIRNMKIKAVTFYFYLIDALAILAR